MNELDYEKIATIVTKATTEAATEAVAKMREFHKEDLQVLSERVDVGFASQDRRMDSLEERMDSFDARMSTFEARMSTFETDLVFVKNKLQEHDERFDRIEKALTTLLQELQKDRKKVEQLEAQVVELTKRVAALESHLTSAK